PTTLPTTIRSPSGPPRPTRTASGRAYRYAGTAPSTRRSAEAVRPGWPSTQGAPEEPEVVANSPDQVEGVAVDRRSRGCRPIHDDEVAVRRQHDLPWRERILKEVESPGRTLSRRRVAQDETDSSMSRDVRSDPSEVSIERRLRRLLVRR